MNRYPLRVQSDFQTLLDALSVRQYLAPHESTESALARVVDQLGVCPQAVEQGICWLHLDRLQSVGRLRRTELMQLARAIHRFWLEQAPAPTDQPVERP